MRKKVFAYYLHNHHGDGIISICARTLPGDNLTLIAANPAKFYSPAYIGPRGWVGLRLDQGEIDWDEVRELIAGSYLQAAPKRPAHVWRQLLLGAKFHSSGFDRSVTVAAQTEISYYQQRPPSS